ncbi:HAD family hydrolase [Lacticaseibacillus brantae]|uniref:Inorganic diphosphatase n=1 Tax=Lacticaseibacillus brantae DSM 23927 TaxID=1423727 RepID=A0A0R2AWS4_9LACO|nr:HAD family hydrolase [Lacticaseibacillus brantae]KRM71902.1 inorganic diphosphatase [Lacticaseibacillus brantae DSM 23927]
MQTYIFDIDGTLIDSVGMYLDGLQKTLRRYGKDYAKEDLTFTNGIPATESLPELGFTSEEIPEVFDQWSQDSAQFADEVDYFPGVKDVLVQLHQHSKLGIVTSKDAQQFAEDDAVFHFSDLVDTVVVAGDAKRNKPFGDPIVLAMERLGGSPENTVFVGDTIADAQAAHDAEVPFALATWTTPVNPAFEPIAYPLDTPADLLKLS